MNQKLKETSKKQMHGLCATRFTTHSMFEQVNDHYAPSMFKACPPLVLSQQKEVQKTKPFQRKNFSGPLLAPPLCGNTVCNYPSTSHSSLKCQPIKKNCILACANPVKSVDAATNPPAMTPEEKIEKLRRRQQLRVILAIQKQQQQFGNPLSAENSTIKGGMLKLMKILVAFLPLTRTQPWDMMITMRLQCP